ncbi:nuclease-related domain-containing protein [Virgibacillus sp. SK37]|uniref:nuclease-related domain-containing protein n=1 Tax=Virgibacillus sp. SK37 TaxID=403957 RepID=UPI0004D0D85E|nr:nuclease-related domain-containing protein [Virgibacillus sp. SK37]AIF45579.1 hypothetical protein X953_16645 [Virgibacillus sp. SK37]
MKLNTRTKPTSLKKYEALLQRLRPNHPNLMEVESKAAREMHGYEGEKLVDYHTDFLTEDFTVVHQLTLKLRGKLFQMDTVVIGENGIYLVEIKNNKGVVTFNTTLKQFSRENGEKEIGYRYPITQVELQKLKLEHWLQQQGYPAVPIYPLIAISKPSTIIKVSGDEEEVARKVHHAEYIPKEILDLDRMNASDIKLPHEKIGRLLLRASSEYNANILQEHGVLLSDLLPGIYCSYCNRLGMERGHNTWMCNHCQKKDQKAHLQALADYFLLVGPSISNSQAQYWLQHNEKSSITRMLRGAGLYHDRRNRKWWWRR